jgi:hypothetical protein
MLCKNKTTDKLSTRLRSASVSLVGKALLIEVIRMNPMATYTSYYSTKLKMIPISLSG